MTFQHHLCTPDDHVHLSYDDCYYCDALNDGDCCASSVVPIHFVVVNVNLWVMPLHVPMIPYVQWVHLIRGLQHVLLMIESMLSIVPMKKHLIIDYIVDFMPPD